MSDRRLLFWIHKPSKLWLILQFYCDFWREKSHVFVCNASSREKSHVFVCNASSREKSHIFVCNVSLREKSHIFVCNAKFETRSWHAEWRRIARLKRLKRHRLKTHFMEDTRLVLTDSSSFAAARLASDNVSRLGSWATPCNRNLTWSELENFGLRQVIGLKFAAMRLDLVWKIGYSRHLESIYLQNGILTMKSIAVKRFDEVQVTVGSISASLLMWCFPIFGFEHNTVMADRVLKWNIQLTCCLANWSFLASSAKISAWPRTAQATSSSSERFSMNSIIERIFENFE